MEKHNIEWSRNGKEKDLPHPLFFFSECEQVCVGEKWDRQEVGVMRHADGYKEEESWRSRATAL